MLRKTKYMLLWAVSVLLSTAASAQSQKMDITGKVSDYETGEAMPVVTLQWLSLPDSSLVVGATTGLDGTFAMHHKVKVGNYLLRCSFVGYQTLDVPFTVQKKVDELRLDSLQLKSDAIMLKEAIIEAQLAEVQVVEDTIMFNAEAFRVPEGSMLEELLRKMPGVEIEDDGTIKVNGRTVDRLLVGGEEFFGNNKQIATQNLPASIVKRVKNYERKSELSRETGIDDGEEEFVLDLEIKRGMMQGWMGNFDGGYGRPTHTTDFVRELGIDDLYTVQAMMNRFESQQQYSIFANTGNVAGGSIGRRGGGRGGGTGLSTNTSAGFNMAKNFGERWKQNQYQYKVGGNVNIGISDGNSQSRSASATLLQNGNKSFSNRWNQNMNASRRASGDFQFEWRPDTMWSIIFRPNFSISDGHNGGSNRSATFNADPEETLSALYPDGTYTPLDPEWTDADGDSRINYSTSANESSNANHSVSGSLQIVKRFEKQGRNLTFRGNGSYTSSRSQSRSTNFTRFYQRNDSTSTINRLSSTPSTSHNLNGRIMWSEPIALATYLQFSYQYNYRYRDNRRSTYELPTTWSPDLDAPEWLWEEAAYDAYRSERLSRFSKDVQNNQDLTLQLRKVTDNYNLNVGFSLMPQTRHMDQQYLGTHIDTTRTVFNWTPTLNYRYRFTKQRSLRVNYRGRSSEPELTQLIEVIDDSDPMNISTGNAALKPTFNNTLRIEYRDYLPDYLRSYNASISAGNTLNNIVNKTIYNEQTGGRFTSPTNLDGFWSTWNANGNFGFNTALGASQRFTIGSNTGVGYNHHESYLRTGSLTATNTEYPLATTHSVNVNQSLSTTYKNDWMDVTLRGNVRYGYALNEMQPDQRQSTWQFNYGPNANFQIPWQEIKISTDVTMNSRRGYSSSEFNTNELIWNGQISKSFLYQNAATVSIQFYDILGQMSNVSRNISSTGHTDTYNNNINSYFLVHFIYRLNLIGDRQTRQEMRDSFRMGGGRPDFEGGEGPRGMGGGDGPRGMGGGGRPMGGF